eukprot:403345425
MRDTDIDIQRDECNKIQLIINEAEQENNKLSDQIELLERELDQFKLNKEQMSQELMNQITQYQNKYKESVLEVQNLRKQNLQIKSQNQNQNLHLQSSQTLLNQEILSLKKKLRSQENQNEELEEQMIFQKQQYLTENNHLRIELSTVEDSLMKTKLTLAQATMEKDLLYLRFKDLVKSNQKLKETINRNQNNLLLTQKRQQQTQGSNESGKIENKANQDAQINVDSRKDSGQSFKSVRSFHKRTESEQVFSYDGGKFLSHQNLNEQAYFTLDKNLSNANSIIPDFNMNKQVNHISKSISLYDQIEGNQKDSLNYENMKIKLQSSNQLPLFNGKSKELLNDKQHTDKATHSAKTQYQLNQNNINNSQIISPIRDSLLSNKSGLMKRTTVDWDKNFN